MNLAGDLACGAGSPSWNVPRSPARHCSACSAPACCCRTDFTQSFSTQELRFVFLHELAHLRRWDLPLNWLVAVLQILHWFNPLVWFGFARWRLDRELACDALAIEAAGADQHREYGRTILHLLENLTPRTAMPGLVGILENKHQLRRRIGMIANFRPGNRWGLPSVVLLLGLALVGLTDAQTAKPQKPTPAPISPNSNAAKSPAASVAAAKPPARACRHECWRPAGSDRPGFGQGRRSVARSRDGFHCDRRTEVRYQSVLSVLLCRLRQAYPNGPAGELQD
ncbi:MAG: M56 family metallopeptidase [Verrucomicrobiota bacterium]